jgi:dTDP-4-amino-4,6-dideoxygalactose transaminase
LPAELAEIGLRQLNRLESILSHRRRLAVTYADVLAEAASRGTLGLLASLPGADPVWLRYPLLVDGAETVISIMRRRGWDLAPRWFSQPVYPPGTDLAAVGYQAGACPGGETLAARVLNLPTHPLIKRELGIRLVEDLLRVVR